jgi:photosystem II stability/assembly factor-like uncharacterized protein
MKRRLGLCLLASLVVALTVLGVRLMAQGPAPQAPPPPAVNQSDDAVLKTFRWRAIGPASMGGRIDDIEVAPNDPYTIYVGYATGGIWKSMNNGTTWTPIFDEYPTSSIGDIAIAPSNADTIYVGTGEPNNRQSSSFGDGVYKSTDGGKKFVYVGLRETQSIGRVVIDPKNADIVYVAAVGHLFGPNMERGVYKTIDGGKTWNLVKFIDENTGVTDIIMDPLDPKTLYAASYSRRRVPWGFNGGSSDSGIWKTTDAGKTWTKLTGNGLPDNPIIGRIGLALCAGKPNVIYAQIEVGASGGTGAGVSEDGSLSAGGRGGAGGAGATGAGRGQAAQAGQQPPAGQQAAVDLQALRAKVAELQQQFDDVSKKLGERNPQVLTARAALSAAQAQLQAAQAQAGQQPGGGRGQQPPDPKRSGLWRSDDKGKTWKFCSNENNRPMYYSKFRVDPNNPDIVWTGGVSFSKSLDGGKTFKNNNGVAHSDHHAIWVDPKNGRHVMVGNDGGLDISYDQGDTFDFVNTVPVGQFYAVSADMRKPYYVCGGLQDNGSWCGPSQAPRSRNNAILNSDWYNVGGGDGFYTLQDPTDWTVMYSESQDGSTNRLDLRGGRGTSIRPNAGGAGRGGVGGGTAAAGAAGRGGAAAGGAAPQTPDPAVLAALAQQMGIAGGGRGGGPNVVPPPESGTQFRFYWNTPILLSPHNPRVIYLGGERLFKSMNRGDTWTYSKDLTNNIGRNLRPIMGVAGDKPMASKHDGAASYSNITTISESYVMPGVIWVGTNDGNLQVSRDGGQNFENVVGNVKGVPKETHVSRVEASHADAGTCYVTFDNHRVDDHKPYVYVTTDYGKTWKSIVANLPAGNTNVIREDPKNPDLLYLGTEYAFYVSLNRGGEWKRFMTGLPTVRIDDILIHPRDNDLIVGTHGRSIWIIDDITPLQQLTRKAMDTDVTLMDPRPAVAWVNDQQKGSNVGGQKHFRGENPQRGTAISYYLKAAVPDVKITIADYTGKVVRTFNACSDTVTQNCAPKTAGLNRVQWTMTGDPPQLPAGAQAAGRGGGGGGGRGGGGGPALEPGTYVLKVTVGGKDYTTKVVVEADNFVPSGT